MENVTNSFLQSIQESYQEYERCGGRSNAKLKPPHQWLADFLRQNLEKENPGKEYHIHSIRQDDNRACEISACGRYYDKKIDIGVEYKNNVVSGMGFKFVTSNYKQNSNNYFENLLGETANIQRKNIAYGALMVLPYKVAYLGRNGGIDKYEIISTHNLEKYLRLYQDRDFPHKPEALGLVFVDIDYENKRVIGLTDINKTEFSSEIKKFLKSEANLEKFLDVFVKLTRYWAAKYGSTK